MYRLKEGLELPKYFKVKVNPEQSKALQEYLFSIGATWGSGEKLVNNIDKPYLYVEYNYINHGVKEYTFYHVYTYLPQIDFKDYFKKEFPEKWCIKVTEENYEELRDWLHKNSSNYSGYLPSWMSYKERSLGQTFYSIGDFSWNHGLCDYYYEEITTEQFREQFGVKKMEHKMPLDKKVNEWQMSDQAQIVFNILYKKGIKFDCHDFEVYLRIFEEGVNFEQQKNK